MAPSHSVGPSPYAGVRKCQFRTIGTQSWIPKSSFYMIIALIGFMGCGKSSVGRELARLLCCPFMDLDEVIEERSGRSIPEIFASDGEAAFRQMEVEALHGILGDMGCLGRSLRSPHRCASLAVPPLSCRGWHGPRPPHILQESADAIRQADTSRDIQSHDVSIENFEKNQTQCVMALGGGTVMTKECAEMVREHTTCIYLRTGVETLVERLSDEADGRPMLGCTSSPAPAGMSLRGAERRGNLRARIEELMALRSGTYEHTAHMIVDTDGKTIEEVAGEIHGILMKKC